MIEFAVYGFIAYVSLLMLIISVVKEVPSGKSQSILRSMWLIPGIITASLLAGMGDTVNFETPGEQNILEYNGTGSLVSNKTISFTEPDRVELINPMWVSVHYMIFVVLLAYVIIQMLLLLVKVN